MADLYPNIHFPKVDSSGLAELPDIYREGQERSALKASLADLDSSDPKSLRAAANRAIALGTKEGIEAGIRLHTVAQARENLAQTATRDAQNSAYVGMLPGLSGLFGGAKAAPGPTEGNPAPFVGGSTPPPQAAPPVAPPTMWNNPTVIGPRSEALPSPSDEIITTAQQGAGAPAAGPQLAGPLPTPDSPPPSKSGLPSWVSGAQAPAVTVPQQQAAPQAPQQPLPPVPGESGRRTELERAMMSLPPKATAQRAAIAEALKAETAKDPTLLPEYKNFYMDQVDKAARGEKTQTIADWRNEVKGAVDLTKDAHETYKKDYRERGRAAESVIQDITGMAELMKNKNFSPGEPGLIDWFIEKTASVNDKLRSIGVPDNMLMSPETVKSWTTPVALREGFAGLAARAVISSLGGLSRQVSNSDREYMASTFGSLILTKQGVTILHKFMGEVAERQKFQAEAAQKYLESNNRASTAQMDAYVDKATLEKYGTKGLLSYDNGKPTLMRMQMDKALVAEPKGAPASARRINRADAKAVGYTDAEIDAYERGQ